MRIKSQNQNIYLYRIVAKIASARYISTRTSTLKKRRFAVFSVLSTHMAIRQNEVLVYNILIKYIHYIGRKNSKRLTTLIDLTTLRDLTTLTKNQKKKKLT